MPAHYRELLDYEVRDLLTAIENAYNGCWLPRICLSETQDGRRTGASMEKVFTSAANPASFEVSGMLCS